ncbi:hypothetical protein [Streptomyces umbrinus]|uniref:hypothetical protein n=1 Tax=Streptomyces umbrinus TaxID=67370 RepID=UPI003C2E71AD
MIPRTFPPAPAWSPDGHSNAPSYRAHDADPGLDELPLAAVTVAASTLLGAER